MKSFPALTPLKLVAISISGKLITTSQDNKYLLDISNQFSKLVHTVPLRSITAECMVKVLVTNWIMAYVPLQRILSDNGKPFTSRFFQHVCNISGTEIVFTTTYHTNPVVESSGTTAPSSPGSDTMLNKTPRTGSCTPTYSLSDAIQRSTGLKTVLHLSSCSRSHQSQSSWNQTLRPSRASHCFISASLKNVA